MAGLIHTAPLGTGTAVLGKTLPAVLYESCDRYDNPKALNQPDGDGWTPLSLDAFRRQSEELALGLAAEGLTHGDRVALFMHSDVGFCLADMGCLMAGLVDVPIYLTQAPEMIQFVIGHAEARALFVSNLELLAQVAPLLAETPQVELVVTAEDDGDAPALPANIRLRSLAALRAHGQARLAEQADAAQTLVAAVDPHDLATIIYTSGTTGQPKGVMLTHENIAYNGLTSFTGMTGYESGSDGEVGLSFLPLTHIFARTLHYGYIYHGSSVYFTTPADLVRDFGRVKPTVFATVPRVLEKVYARILEKAATLSGAQQKILHWALDLAREYELGQEPSTLKQVQYAAADKLVYSKWRAVMGGRVKMIICGGAALSGDLANLFGAAGINVLQGYGLSETSPVITYNRPDRNRAGTVGEPIPGVEVRIADDGEILTRGPHVMQGYYKDEAKTREAIDDEGWFHTGDIGAFTDEGYLRITDRKKDLFKLSTGKYVMPQPLENRLSTEPLIQHAVVVGSSRRFCGALLFPEPDALRTVAATWGLDPDLPMETLLTQPLVVEHYQELVDKANVGMDHWSTIKKFALVPDEITIENGLMTPTLKVKRARVNTRFADVIDALY